MITYEAYGLTPEKAEEFGVRDLEMLRDSVPQLYYACIEDPPEIKPLIDRWEAVKITDIGKGYAATRGWNNWMAVREYIQNALDEEHELFGYENIRIKIWFDDKGLHIVNRGRPIKLEHWFLRPTKKKEWVRGKFGEGMDIASELLLFKGYRVYIFSHNAVYKTVYTPSGYMAIVMGISTRYIDGTEVIIYGLTGASLEVPIDKITVQNLKQAYKLLKEYKIIEKNMPETAMIFEGYRDAVYVRDIYVNTCTNIFGKPCYYAYNLWWVELESNRRLFADNWEARYRITKILTSNPEAYVRILLESSEKVYDNVIGMDKIVLRSDKFYEILGILLYRIDSKTAEIIAKMYIEGLKEKFGLTDLAYANTNDIHEIALASHVGVHPVVVPETIYNVFGKKHATVSGIYLDAVFTGTTERKVYSDEELPIQLLRYVYVAKLFAKILDLKDKVKIRVTDQTTSSFDRFGLISFAVNDLKNRPFDAILEELGHAYGFLVKGMRAEDATTVLTRAIKEMIEKILFRLSEPTVSYVYNRIMGGLVYSSKDKPIFGLRAHEDYTIKIYSDVTSLIHDLSMTYTLLDRIKYNAFDKIMSELRYHLLYNYDLVVLTLRIYRDGDVSVRVKRISDISGVWNYTVKNIQQIIDSEADKMFEDIVSKSTRYTLLVITIKYDYLKDEYVLYKYWVNEKAFETS